MMHRSSAPSAALAALTLACVAAPALPGATLGAQITAGSTLVFTGVADATDVGKAGVLLDFDKRIAVDASANTGTFASLNRPVGATGTVADLTVGNGPQRLDAFLHVAGYTFDLRLVPSGAYGQDDCYVEPLLGQRCTPYQSVVGDPSDNAGLSPFYVENRASGDPTAPFTARAAFDVFGIVTGPGRASSPFTGTIAATFVGQSYQEVLWTLEQEGLRGVTFTGTFVAGAPVVASAAADTVVPEPSTVALVATGLGALGAAGRARTRRRAARG